MKHTILGLIMLGLGIALSSQRLSAQGQMYQLQIPSTAPWTDTGIDLVAGSRLVISASGEVYDGIWSVSPDGLAYGDVVYRAIRSTIDFTVASSLIGKIGGTIDPSTGAPVPEGYPDRGIGYVGTAYDQVVLDSGRLFLGFNDYLPGLTYPPDSGFPNNSGVFDVSISVTPVPEPHAFVLLSIGLGVIVFRRRTG